MLFCFCKNFRDIIICPCNVGDCDFCPHPSSIPEQGSPTRSLSPSKGWGNSGKNSCFLPHL